MGKFAVFTAIIGGYDSICDPLAFDDSFDFILFTDHVVTERVGVWKVRQVEYHNEDPIRIARYVKTHPEELLPEYDATLWMDANLQITDYFLYDRVKALNESDVQVASILHPSRDCAYSEAFEVSRMRFEHSSLAIRWCKLLWKEKYPLNQGLFETNIFYRKRTPLVSLFDADWWNAINSFSKRDQLSCNYCLWKNNVPIGFVLPQGSHAKKTEHVNFFQHGQKSQRKLIRIGLSERVLLRVWRIMPSYSYWCYLKLRKTLFPSFSLFLWGWLTSIIAFLIWLSKKIRQLTISSN